MQPPQGMQPPQSLQLLQGMQPPQVMQLPQPQGASASAIASAMLANVAKLAPRGPQAIVMPEVAGSMPSQVVSQSAVQPMGLAPETPFASSLAGGSMPSSLPVSDDDGGSEAPSSRILTARAILAAAQCA